MQGHQLLLFEDGVTSFNNKRPLYSDWYLWKKGAEHKQIMFPVLLAGCWTFPPLITAIFSQLNKGLSCFDFVHFYSFQADVWRAWCCIFEDLFMVSWTVNCNRIFLEVVVQLPCALAVTPLQTTLTLYSSLLYSCVVALMAAILA